MITVTVPISIVRKENRLDAEHYTGNPTEEDAAIARAETQVKKADTALVNRKADKADAIKRRERFGVKQ